MQKNGLAFVDWVLTLLVFAPGSYDIYPGYPGHGGPSLSWPWRQALGHSCSVSTLGAVGVGMVLVQLLPSFQGPGWPPDFSVPRLFCTSSSSEPTTTWSSLGDLVHNHVQLCAAHTCAGRHLQRSPSPSDLLHSFPVSSPLLLLSHSQLKDRTGSSSS